MPSIIYGFRILLLISLVSLLFACDNSETKRTHYIEEGKRLFKTGDYQQANTAFDEAVAVDPENIQAHLQIAEEISSLGDIQSAVNHYQAIVKQDQKQITAYIKLGQIYLLAGKIPVAEKMAKEALALDANSIEALVLMGGVLSAQNNTDAAFVKAEQALNKKPDEVSATLLLASLNAKIGNLEKAKNLLQNCIDKNPDNIGSRLLLANLYLQTDTAEKARELLTSIIKLEPKQLIHRQRLAMFFIDAKQLDKAEEVFRNTIKELPDDEQAKLLLIDFLANKRTEEVAIAELIPMIEQKSDDYELRFKLANLQLAQKHYDEVEEILKDTIDLAKQNPQVVKARNKLAQFYLAGNRIEEARTLITTNLTEQPKNVDTLILKAELALADQKVTEAITELRVILIDQPENIKALKLLSTAHRLNNDQLLAMENLQKVLEITPNDEITRLDLVDLLLKTGNAKQAEQQLNTLFKINPDSKKGLEALAKIYLAQKRWEQALQVAKQLQVNFTNDASGYYLEGLSYQAEGKVAQSIEPLVLALQKQPQAIEPLSLLISSYLVLKQPEKALAKLNEIIKKQPDHFFAYNLLGGVYSNNNQLAEAIAAYQKAIELKPAWAKSYRNLALIKRIQKKPQEAIEILTKGISSSADTDELVNDLVQIYHQQGEYNRVIAIYEKIHQQRPGSLTAINDLVSYTTAYAKDASQLEHAAQLLEPLLQSNNPYLLDTAAWFYYRQGHYQQAKQTLLKAQELNVNSAVSQYHLGMIFHKLGDNLQAKNYLQKAVNQKVEFNGLKEAKEILKSLETK